MFKQGDARRPPCVGRKAMSDAARARHFTSQRLRLHYAEWGSPDKPPLLLVHGSRDHCRAWDWTAERLAADWHILAPDARGHGDSEWASDGVYTSAAYIYDLAELVRLHCTAPVTIVAHSAGGSISAGFAALYPEHMRKLVLIDGLGISPESGLTQGHPNLVRRQLPADEELRSWIDARRSFAEKTPRRYPSVDAAAERLLRENAFLRIEQALHLTTHGLRRTEDGGFVWKFDNLVRLAHPQDRRDDDFLLMLSKIACPTLLLWGSASYTPDPRHDIRAHAVRNARIEVLEGASHWLHHDGFDWFIAQLKAFL